MTRRKNLFVFILLLVFLAVSVLVMMNRRPEANRSGNPEAADGPSQAGFLSSRPVGQVPMGNASPATNFIAAYQTPIEFYGKVVDQYGDPVGGASVKIFPFNNAFGESATKMVLASDAQGLFSVKEIKGLAMGVEVRKDGYLTKSDLGFERPASSRRIEYGLDGSGGSRFKDPNKPTLFTLHKLGPLEPLVYVAERRWKLPADGTPQNIALDSSNGTGSHQIEFRFTTEWAKFSKDSDAIFGMFDWKLEIRIPGGGFAKNRSDYQFEAPDTGYRERILIDHPTKDPNWSKIDMKRYFVRFPDGTYGRIRFTIEGISATKPLLMTSWMNLKPGSRNLNSDKKDCQVMLDE